jgi:hypothetical protein
MLLMHLCCRFGKEYMLELKLGGNMYLTVPVNYARYYNIQGVSYAGRGGYIY